VSAVADVHLRKLERRRRGREKTAVDGAASPTAVSSSSARRTGLRHLPAWFSLSTLSLLDTMALPYPSKSVWFSRPLLVLAVALLNTVYSNRLCPVGECGMYHAKGMCNVSQVI